VLQKALCPDQYTVQSPASSQLTLANLSFHWVHGLRESGRASSQKLAKSRLRWWWWLLLLVNLHVQLQMVECLEYTLHELILSGYELFYLRFVVGVVGLTIAGLTVALIVPCVHHLRDF
jgi:hypothetical protein